MLVAATEPAMLTPCLILLLWLYLYSTVGAVFIVDVGGVLLWQFYCRVIVMANH